MNYQTIQYSVTDGVARLTLNRPQVANALNTQMGHDIYDVFGIYGWKFCDIRVAPDNEDEIYILGNRMYHSTDGGRTYARIGETIRRVNPIPGTASNSRVHRGSAPSPIISV